MFSFNNENYCEYCFEKASAQSSFCPACGSRNDPHRFPGSMPVGHVLAGKYIVGKVLGQGGFGKTYLCFDIRNNTRVAIKEYFPENFAFRNPGDNTVYPKQNNNTFKKGAKKFFKEARILVQFKDCPEIVRVEKLFEENNTTYFVMEYLTGKDLRSYLQNVSRVDENFVICIAIEVLKGLRRLHEKGVLHRDIAPDNIFMCSDGTVKLIDFGASRLTVGVISNSLSLVLKPGFAPFEQYQTKGTQGPWTDIYALGATIYYLLKRKLPPESVARVNNSSLDMSGISPYLAKVITKMMAMKPSDRYQTADEVIPELAMAQRMNTGHRVVPPSPAISRNNAAPVIDNSHRVSADANEAAVRSNPEAASPPSNNVMIDSGPEKQKWSAGKIAMVCAIAGTAYLLTILLLLCILL